MILYLTDAGRIKQRILCCRKFILIFGSSDEYRLLKFSFRAWQKYCILSLLSLGWFSKGILINISPKKNAFVRVFTLTTLWLSTILKLDFLKSPGKSGSASPSRGMKLGNTFHVAALLCHALLFSLYLSDPNLSACSLRTWDRSAWRTPKNVCAGGYSTCE